MVRWHYQKGETRYAIGKNPALYSSFQKPTRIVMVGRAALQKEATFHPTQKPIRLYEWVITNYAAAGDKILDTHAGSGACLMAAYRTGHNFLGFEADADYFTEADRRLQNEMAQMRFAF